MNWLKRWLRRDDDQHILLEDIVSSINVLSESVSKSEIGTQKGFRRLSMAQKQQSDTLALLAQESGALKFALAERHGLTFTYEKILHTLDNLSKIHHAADNTACPKDVMAPLIERTTEDLLSLCGLEAIAEIGKPYPAKACEVVGSLETPDQQWPPGTVVEVLQQGYQSAQGGVVRAAKVIVSRETFPTSTITQLEEKD